MEHDSSFLLVALLRPGLDTPPPMPHAQVMRGSITRQLPLVNIVVNSTLVVWACAELKRDLMSERTRWCFVIGTPLLSYYCLVGLWLARRLPQAGEALRTAKSLGECRRDQQASALLVLAIEFVQFNSLPFNSELGAWHELDFSSLFRYSFLQCEEGCARWVPPFDAQLRFYCTLGLAWVLFALITLFISHVHQRQLNPSKLAAPSKVDGECATKLPTRMQPLSLRTIVRETIDEGLASARGLGGFDTSRAGFSCAPCAGAGHAPSSLITAGGGLGGVNSAKQEVIAAYTMSSPLWQAVLAIVRFARNAWRLYVRLLGGARDSAQRALWEVRHFRPGAMVPVLLLLLLTVLMALVVIGGMLTLFLACAVLCWCLFGLLVCAAFAAVTLLHFGIVMNMLSVLICTEAASLPKGTVPELLRLADAQVMQRLPTQQCWAGAHWNMVAIALSTLIVLYPVMVFFERKRRAAAMVSYHVRFTSHFLFGKLALSAFSLAFVAWPPAYLLGCAAALFAFLHVNNEREQDNQPACCNIRTVRLLRSMVLCCALWSFGVTLATYVLPLSQASLVAALFVLWALTAAYFFLIICLPHLEPRYHSEPPSVSGRSICMHSGGGTPMNIGEFAAPFGAQDAGIGRCCALIVPHVPAEEPAPWKAHNLAEGGPSQGVGTSPAHARGLNFFEQYSSAPLGSVMRVRQECDNVEPRPPWASASLGQRTRLLGPVINSREATAAAERPKALGLSLAAARAIRFLNDDNGFERLPPSAEQAPPRAAPILMSATLAQDHDAAHEHCSGGLHVFERVLGVINGVGAAVANAAVLTPTGNGLAQGPNATELECQLKEARGPVTLLLQRPAVRLRADGYKRGAVWEQLKSMEASQIVHNMSLYPQDACLQAECCMLLRLRLECLSVSETADAAGVGRDACKQRRMALLHEFAESGTLGVVVNALESHEGFAAVQLEAAAFLKQLTESSGSLRVHIVAAGALPALIRALRRHANMPDVVVAHCELAAEIGGARGAPARTRRDLCMVLAGVGVLAAVLHALHQHPHHERIAGACCALLLAFMEEFEAHAQEAPPELYKLFGVPALRSALAEARAHCAESATVKLAATWFLAQKGASDSVGNGAQASSDTSPRSVGSTPGAVTAARFGCNASDSDGDLFDKVHDVQCSTSCSHEPRIYDPYDSDPFESDSFSRRQSDWHNSCFSKRDSDPFLSATEHGAVKQMRALQQHPCLGHSTLAAASCEAMPTVNIRPSVVPTSPLSDASSGSFSRPGSCNRDLCHDSCRDSDPFVPDSGGICLVSTRLERVRGCSCATDDVENEVTYNANRRGGSTVRATANLISPTALVDGRLSVPPPPAGRRSSLTYSVSSQLSTGDDGMMRRASLSTMQV